MLGKIHPLMLRGLFGRFTSFVGSQLAPCRLKTCVSYCCSKKVLLVSPAVSWRSCPISVSPGAGKRGTRILMSRFSEPTIVTNGRAPPLVPQWSSSHHSFSGIYVGEVVEPNATCKPYCPRGLEE